MLPLRFFAKLLSVTIFGYVLLEVLYQFANFMVPTCNPDVTFSFIWNWVASVDYKLANHLGNLGPVGWFGRPQCITPWCYVNTGFCPQTAIRFCRDQYLLISGLALTWCFLVELTNLFASWFRKWYGLTLFETEYRGTVCTSVTLTDLSECFTRVQPLLDKAVTRNDQNPHCGLDHDRVVFTQLAANLALKFVPTNPVDLAGIPVSSAINDIGGLPKRYRGNRMLAKAPIGFVWTNEPRYANADAQGRPIQMVAAGGEVSVRGYVAVMSDQDWFYHPSELCAIAAHHSYGLILNTVDFTQLQRDAVDEYAVKFYDNGLEMSTKGGDTYSHGYHEWWRCSNGFVAGWDARTGKGSRCVYNVIGRKGHRMLIWIRPANGQGTVMDSVRSVGIRRNCMADGERFRVNADMSYSFKGETVAQKYVYQLSNALLGGGSAEVHNRATQLLANKGGAEIPSVFTADVLVDIAWHRYMRDFTERSWFAWLCKDTMPYHWLVDLLWRCKVWCGMDVHVVIPIDPLPPLVEGRVDVTYPRFDGPRSDADAVASHKSRSLPSERGPSGADERRSVSTSKGDHGGSSGTDDSVDKGDGRGAEEDGAGPVREPVRDSSNVSTGKSGSTKSRSGNRSSERKSRSDHTSAKSTTSSSRSGGKQKASIPGVPESGSLPEESQSGDQPSGGANPSAPPGDSMGDGADGQAAPVLCEGVEPTPAARPLEP